MITYTCDRCKDTCKEDDYLKVEFSGYRSNAKTVIPKTTIWGICRECAIDFLTRPLARTMDTK